MGSSIHVDLSPNPSSEKLNLKITDSRKEITSVQGTDVTGKLLFSSGYNPSNTEIDVRHLKPGPYILTLKNESGIILVSKKFIIAR